MQKSWNNKAKKVMSNCTKILASQEMKQCKKTKRGILNVMKNSQQHEQQQQQGKWVVFSAWIFIEEKIRENENEIKCWNMAF